MSDVNAKRWNSIFLDPCDVLLFRDGRPFDATNRVLSGLPVPQTVAGAIRTAMLTESGFSFSKIRNYQGAIVDRLRDAGAATDILDARFRGPWLARREKPAGMIERLVPCPKNLRSLKNDSRQWMVARPQDPNTHPIDGWQHADNLDNLWPLKFPGEPEPKFESVYLTPNGLSRYMTIVAQSGPAVFELKRHVDFINKSDIYGMDHRIGIGISSTNLTTMKGELYGIGLLALQPGYGIVMDVELTERLASSLRDLAVPIGGEGKLVRLAICEIGHSDQHVTASGNAFRYLSTPTFLTDQITPNRPLPPSSCGKLIAAASDRPIGISGWDVARGGPRPNRFAVPAGAVYFFEGPVADELIDIFSDRAERLQEGWGYSIPGIWSR